MFAGAFVICLAYFFDNAALFQIIARIGVGNFEYLHKKKEKGDVHKYINN